MSLHHDLLEQAEHLALREPKKPRQASLRRAVSAGYYALFHMLLSEGTLALVPNKPAALRLQAQRALDHAEMKKACQKFATNLASVQFLLDGALEPELVQNRNRVHRFAGKATQSGLRFL